MYSVMSDFLTLPWYLTAAPICAAIGAIIVSKVLNISQIASFLGAFLPFGLPYADLSVPSRSLLSKPPVQILGGWGMMLAVALVWVLGRALLRAVKGPVGLLRAIYSVLLGVAGFVVVLLIADPKMLNTHAPTWRESFGGVLLTTMVFSVAITLVRVFKTAAFLVLCSVATAILASQVFFEKMPYDLEKADIQKIENALPDSLPKGLIESGLEGFMKVSATSRSSLQSTTSEDIES
jgi:hypothetical protein